MDVTPLIPKGQKIIQKYAGGVFRISGESYDHPVIIVPDRVLPWTVSMRDMSALTIHDFRELIDLSPQFDVFLMGCGATMAFPPQALKKELKNQGIALDTMDTGAACRTYNVLMAEGRRVAALLLPV